MEIIAQHGTIFIILAVVLGFYACWGIGANDVANAMGTSVGSGAITIKQAIIIAAICEFAGAFLAGGAVTKTIQKGIIDPSSVASTPEILVYGMLATLLGTAIWLMAATAKGWPVSTSHSVVGSIVGFAVVGIGVDAVQWSKISGIVASWLISPLLGGAIAYVIMFSLQRLIFDANDPLASAKRWGPFYVFLVGFMVCLVTLFKGLSHLKLNLSPMQSFIAAVVFGILVAFIGRILINRVTVSAADEKKSRFTGVEKVFTPLMVFTACAMAFAHGSNDVANGIGPVAAVISVVQAGGEVSQKAGLPLWVLIMGGIGIVVGLATMGYRVMATIGEKITPLTPTRGYAATLAAAATVVLASKTGMPVSTTHIAVGAVMGVGLTRGIGALDMRVLGQIVVSWVITLPIAGVLAAVFFLVMRAIFS
jgi:PiT family inorganic phosphate transporter